MKKRKLSSMVLHIVIYAMPFGVLAGGLFGGPSMSGVKAASEAVDRLPEDTEGSSETTAVTGFRIQPYHDILVGPLELNNSRRLVMRDLDLSVLWEFIRNKTFTWRAKRVQELAELGISEDQIEFTNEEGFTDASHRVLAMTGVFRNYTFCNRIVCEWYADHLWEISHNYYVEIEKADGTRRTGNTLLAAESMLEANDAEDESGDKKSGSRTSDSEEKKKLKGISGNVSSEDTVKIVLSNRSENEVYDTDAFQTRIPITWDGWSEEKREECEELMKLDEKTLLDTLLQRQQESLLYSPVPFFKQGAAEWGGQTFGGGTIASDGCCPTAIAMAISALKSERITPAEIAARYDTDTYRNVDQGSYGGKMCQAAGEDYGLHIEAGTVPLSEEQIRSALSSGGIIVMSMKPSDGGGRYATVYHYVTLAGLTEDGLVIVNNPGINSDITYDSMEMILANQSGRGFGIFRK